MSMRVERSSLEQVDEHFQILKMQKTPGTFTAQVNTSERTRQVHHNQSYKADSLLVPSLSSLKD
ncbi:unnamed protein product [Arabis nemorensis]|uniref:Uncharacterized protein n=1 Tax=Arabis nemorensis TaxID=586526 RepID=A0A565BTV4_9BRAS|nr:unnamed protein product [Arabis nemorensis]